jgi:hypothetical protein
LLLFGLQQQIPIAKTHLPHNKNYYPFFIYRGIPGREPVKVGMQGGFWIVRPNQTAFDELITLIRRGQFSKGWFDGNVHYPGFYGAAMIQGLVAFYYGHFHPNQALELQRCVHNQMVDNPTASNGKCYISVDGECRDCRIENTTNIFSCHFTFCGKPVSLKPQ